jgi:hypothetical protein
MKKLIIVIFTMVILVSGCAGYKTPNAKSWEKEGTLREERRQDYKECSKISSISYVKEGTSLEEAKKDFDFCFEAQKGRVEHEKTIRHTIILLGPAGLLASQTISASVSTHDYCQRCMESKGYKTIELDTEAKCMREKGYEWK